MLSSTVYKVIASSNHYRFICYTINWMFSPWFIINTR
nr:MAG TPA: hypothetical protein [Caudoviricetes sp.]